MKKVIITILICCNCKVQVIASSDFTSKISFNTYQQDTLINFLESLYLGQFYNKPIDTFISRIPHNYQSIQLLGGSRGDMVAKVSINYASNVYILIRVLHFEHLDPTNPNKLPPSQVWDINLMRKEKIYSIRIYSGDLLINNMNED